MERWVLGYLLSFLRKHCASIMETFLPHQFGNELSCYVFPFLHLRPFHTIIISNNISYLVFFFAFAFCIYRKQSWYFHVFIKSSICLDIYSVRVSISYFFLQLPQLLLLSNSLISYNFIQHVKAGKKNILKLSFVCSFYTDFQLGK